MVLLKKLTIMFAALAFGTSMIARDATVSIYKTEFGSEVKEAFAVTGEVARRGAVPVDMPAKEIRRLESLFRPTLGASERLASIRFAARLEGKWMYVDKHGFAMLGPQFGTVDVLGVEELWRKILPGAGADSYSQLLRVTVVNRTSKEVQLSDVTGRFSVRVSASKVQKAKTVAGPLSLSWGGRRIGNLRKWPPVFDGPSEKIRVSIQPTDIRWDHERSFDRLKGPPPDLPLRVVIEEST